LAAGSRCFLGAAFFLVTGFFAGFRNFGDGAFFLAAGSRCFLGAAFFLAAGFFAGFRATAALNAAVTIHYHVI
jgi:hypothetical protein